MKLKITVNDSGIKQLIDEESNTIIGEVNGISWAPGMNDICTCCHLTLVNVKNVDLSEIEKSIKPLL